MSIVSAARKLAEDKIILDSYTAYDDRKQLWVYSKNIDLTKGRLSKPVSFPENSKADFDPWWKDLSLNMKVYLYSMFSKDTAPEIFNLSKNYNNLKTVWEKWPNSYHVIYFGVEGHACNLFVGETLYNAGFDDCTNSGKYYSAKDIWDAKGPYTAVDKAKEEVLAGDIAAFDSDSQGDGGHVEIVTKVDGNSFCSIGAGRGSGGFLMDANGVETCGWEPISMNRYINHKDIRFLRVE